MECHINAEELLSAKFSLKAFVKGSDTYVKLLSDNTTTVHNINNMHSNESELCHSIMSEIWTYAEDKNIWITASYIPGKENYDTDAESRKKRSELEWMLYKKILQKLFLSSNFNQRWTYLHQGSMPNHQCLSHTILTQWL